MFCIRPLCGGTAQCGGQMRDKGTAVTVGAKAADLLGDAWLCWQLVGAEAADLLGDAWLCWRLVGAEAADLRGAC
jgi:hypothetical protein